ncbi:Hypothetical predicted protein [Mytilus galloprovincialis]|uniref:DDE-1 domain-containing protein n=1 Tax=Mytilus galloprovincialis TaxID=29158 RepID=A0A8B6CK84_MYTGA|nr:Hypothetical predicted protein [Mytilus galloprovincialis]
MRDYFKLLKSTLETNDLKDKPERLYNCDEAGLSLNKSSGQRVVVPKRFKHAHSISIATSEHISVHCCVNAAGHSLPPMLIFSGGYPGGAYHKNGPINAAYATTDSGFMDKETYFQWFEKVFLQHCVKERPIMLLQDGAISHISPMLIDSALKNDVILLCLPSKTTHILQPLDVAVYKNMKIETAKQVSNAKMLKSDLWVSKKNVSSIFKVIFERSFTMACITQGFKKCGIYPFDPNAIDKTLLFRGGNDVNPDDLDLSLNDEPTNESELSAIEDNTTSNTENEPEHIVSAMPSTSNTGVTTVMDLEVGADGILSPIIHTTSEATQSSNEIESSSTTICPPELALSAIESALTPRKKRKYENAFSSNTMVKGDVVFHTWKNLKISCTMSSSSSDSTLPINVSNESINSMSSSSLNVQPSYCPEPSSHPLVKAGLIPDDLVSVLVVPKTKDVSGRTKRRKGDGKARILSTKEIQEELDSKEKKKKEDEKKQVETKGASREKKSRENY